MQNISLVRGCGPKIEVTMSRITILTILTLTILLFFSCKDRSTGPQNELIHFSSLSSKCVSSGLGKNAFPDSIFTYTFSTTLVIDFSVSANCCPDSDRFSVSYAVTNDTIIVSVADTARNLCRCACTYMVHAEFDGLSLNHYVVRCTIFNSQGDAGPVHLTDVHRKSQP
jgi:hypothetical protein